MCRNGTDNPFEYYNYDSPDGLCDAGPTRWITILFIVLFGITTFLHVVQAVIYRKWFFLPTMATGGFGEVIGWVGRLWSSHNPDSFQAFVMQITTTIFAPTFMTAANFIVLGRMISYTRADRYARLSAKRFTWFFLSFDITCLFIQSAGGGIASSKDITQARVGTDIALVGIALQTVAIAVYSLVAGEFIWRLAFEKPLSRGAWRWGSKTWRKELDEKESQSDGVETEEGRPEGMRMTASGRRIPMRVQLVFWGLAISTLFFLIRAIYRLIEFADGWGHRIQSTETLFNVLDGGCVVFAMFVINFFHPGMLIKDPW